MSNKSWYAWKYYTNYLILNTTKLEFNLKCLFAEYVMMIIWKVTQFPQKNWLNDTLIATSSSVHF